MRVDVTKKMENRYMEPMRVKSLKRVCLSIGGSLSSGHSSIKSCEITGVLYP